MFVWISIRSDFFFSLKANHNCLVSSFTGKIYGINLLQLFFITLVDVSNRSFSNYMTAGQDLPHFDRTSR